MRNRIAYELHRKPERQSRPLRRRAAGSGVAHPLFLVPRCPDDSPDPSSGQLLSPGVRLIDGAPHYSAAWL